MSYSCPPARPPSNSHAQESRCFWQNSVDSESWLGPKPSLKGSSWEEVTLQTLSSGFITDWLLKTLGNSNAVSSQPFLSPMLHMISHSGSSCSRLQHLAMLKISCVDSPADGVPTSGMAQAHRNDYGLPPGVLYSGTNWMMKAR